MGLTKRVKCESRVYGSYRKVLDNRRCFVVKESPLVRSRDNGKDNNRRTGAHW